MTIQSTHLSLKSNTRDQSSLNHFAHLFWGQMISALSMLSIGSFNMMKILQYFLAIIYDNFNCFLLSRCLLIFFIFPIKNHYANSSQKRRKFSRELALLLAFLICKRQKTNTSYNKAKYRTSSIFENFLNSSRIKILTSQQTLSKLNCIWYADWEHYPYVLQLSFSLKKSRWNSHKIKLTLLKCTIQWQIVHSKCCATTPCI